MEIVIGLSIFIIFIIAITSIRVVQQSTVGIISRLGKFNRKAEMGVNFVIPFIEGMSAKINLREQVVDFPPQPVITSDNVTMQIDTVVYYQVTDPVRFTYEISNPMSAIENLTATTLRNIIGELDLDATLTSRDIINTKMRAILDEATDKWGIRINRVELKNIMPPKEIRDAMEKQMRAERERRESILRAEGEKRSAVLKAEGEKEAAILNAEAEKEAAIRRAEGQKQSQILRASGEAEGILLVEKAKGEGIKLVYNAIKESDPTSEVIKIRSLEALEQLANGQATKLVVPSEVVGILGSLAGIKEVFEKQTK